MLHRLKADEADQSERFRSQMRALASGVCVVTSGIEPNRSGFTASSVISLSVAPPRLLVSIMAGSSTLEPIEQTGRFSVAVLADHQQAIAEHFAGRTGLSGDQRFREHDWNGTRLVGALANIHCVLEEAIKRHDHILLLGRPVDGDVGDSEDGPLVYWRGAFRHP